MAAQGSVKPVATARRQMPARSTRTTRKMKEASSPSEGSAVSSSDDEEACSRQADGIGQSSGSGTAKENGTLPCLGEL